MSAAATAAGYLYASGRLRGRGQREQEQGEPAAKPAQASEPPRKPKVAAMRKEVRVAALPPQADKPRRQPTIQYRTRRWRPQGSDGN
jgi:hypothetical protein